MCYFYPMHQNFLAKRPDWPEPQEPEVVPTAGAAVAYQQVNIVPVSEFYDVSSLLPARVVWFS